MTSSRPLVGSSASRHYRMLATGSVSLRSSAKLVACDDGCVNNDRGVRLLRLIRAVSAQPSWELTAVVFNALRPALPRSLSYEVEGTHVVAFMEGGSSMGTGGLLIPRLRLPARIDISRQVRNIAHALVDTFAPLDECAAQGARLAVRRTNEGIRIELKDSDDRDVVFSAFLPWAALQKQRPTTADPRQT